MREYAHLRVPLPGLPSPGQPFFPVLLQNRRRTHLKRIISRVAVVRSEDSHLDDLADPSMMGDLDEDDPKSIARWMRKMSAETGEEMPQEFDEVIDRLESGQSPEQIEDAMPGLADDMGGGMGPGMGGGMDDLL